MKMIKRTVSKNVSIGSIAELKGTLVSYTISFLQQLVDKDPDAVFARGIGDNNLAVEYREELPQESVDEAKDKTLNNKKNINNNTVCGCFTCLSIFKGNKIMEWVDWNDDFKDENKSARCPFCSKVTVIPDVEDANYLFRINEHWLSEKPLKVSTNNFSSDQYSPMGAISYE